MCFCRAGLFICFFLLDVVFQADSFEYFLFSILLIFLLYRKLSGPRQGLNTKSHYVVRTINQLLDNKDQSLNTKKDLWDINSPF